MDDYQRRLIAFRNRKRPAKAAPVLSAQREDLKPEPKEREFRSVDRMTFPELRAAAKAMKIAGYGKMTKVELTEALKG